MLTAFYVEFCIFLLTNSDKSIRIYEVLKYI